MINGKLQQSLAGAKYPLKFKASTLTHIAELKSLGQEKIENQFIERLYKDQTGFDFGRYIKNT